MGVVEDVPNFRDWVDKLLKIAPMDGRSWKTLSQRFGWKVKTHGKSFYLTYIFYFSELISILLSIRICYSRSYCRGGRGFSYLFGKGPRNNLEFFIEEKSR